MSKRWIQKGTSNQTIDIFIQDGSSSDGDGLTGLTHASAGLVCYYRIGATGSAVQLNLVAQTVGGAHSDGGFVAISDTNMSGVYRLDLSDIMVQTEGSLTIFLQGAANMVPVPIEIEVVAVNILDQNRMGLLAIPNAAAGSAGGLPTGDSNGNVTVGQYATGQAPLKPIIPGREISVLSDGGVSVSGIANGAVTFAALNPDVEDFIRSAVGLSESDLETRLDSILNSILNVGNNTRVRSSIPSIIERPDSGSQLIPLTVELYDSQGNMEAPDSTPTISLTSRTGTDLSSRIGSISNPSTGRYTFNYTNSSSDDLDQVIWVVTVSEGGNTRTYTSLMQIVDTTSADFTSTDRTNLNTIASRIDVGLSTRLASADYVAPDNASIATILARTDVAVSTRLAAASYVSPDNAGISTLLTRASEARLQILERVSTLLEADGIIWRFTENALEQSPSGGGGGEGSVVYNRGPFILELASAKRNLSEQGSGEITLRASSAFNVIFRLTINGNPVSLVGAEATSVFTDILGQDVGILDVEVVSDVLGYVTLSGTVPSTQGFYRIFVKRDDISFGPFMVRVTL
jgi:hypothetical protein